MKLQTSGAITVFQSSFSASTALAMWGVFRRGTRWQSTLRRKDSSLFAMWSVIHIANNELSLRLKVDCQRVPLLKTPHIASAVDALKLDWKTVIAPDVCSFILGNPPYKGAKQQTEPERERLRSIAELGGSGGTLDHRALQ